jgi:GGDEF domain-containing protein
LRKISPIKVRQALNLPFPIDRHLIGISSSIGITLYPQHGTEAKSLIENVDIAMYYAKQGGRDCYQFYGEHMQEAAQQT